MFDFFQNIPPLNSPLVSFISTLFDIGVGVFILFKNPRARVNRAFAAMMIPVSGWFFGNTASMYYYYDFDSALVWFRIAYSFVGFLAPAYYYFYLVVTNKKSKFLYFLVLLGVLELIYMWTGKSIVVGLHFVPNVGGVWKGMPFWSYVGLFGMLKYFFISILCGRLAAVSSAKEPDAYRKRQLKSFSVLFYVLSLGFTEWLVVLNIPLHIAWIVTPLFIIALAYNIARYRLMEIETVIHKTFLWIASICFLIAPVSIAGLILFYKLRTVLSLWTNVFLFGVFLFLFVAYYVPLRPRIDHLFRRRKYDYLQILGEISHEISGIMDIDELSQKTLHSIKETMYPRSIHLLLRDGKKKEYYVKSVFMDNDYESFSRDFSPFVLPESFETMKFLQESREPIERDLLNFDPQYKDIKAEAEELFERMNSILLFGLFMEEELVGILFLGKRENLQVYTRLDINAMHDLSVSIASSFYTALHHQDILEGQRLLQEVTLARHIQENLLPRQAPRIPGVSLYGLYIPSKEIGGDYYDFIVQEDAKDGENGVYITIGDVSGKGMDAGLVVSSVKSFLVSLLMYNHSCKSVLNILNQSLYTYLGQQKFISLLLLQYLPHRSSMTYSAAGHERILIYKASGDIGTSSAEVKVVKSGGVVLGMIDNIEEYLEEQELVLEKGDKVLLYTDGATEARNPQEDLYSLSRLIDSFKNHGHLTIKDTIQNIYSDIKSFISTRDQYDDITLVGIEKE